MVVDRLHRREDIAREAVFRQGLADLGDGGLAVGFPELRQDLRLSLRPDLHLDHRALLPVDGLGEDERILVLDVALIDWQSLSLPAQPPHVFQQIFLGLTDSAFDRRLDHVLEPEPRLA